MQFVLHFILPFLLQCVFLEIISCSYVLYEPQIDVYYDSRRTCGGWFWNRRCSYQSVQHEQCSAGFGGIECTIPICSGGAVENSCNMEEGRVILKDNTVLTNSGGTCVGPYTCSDCNPGYFAPAENASYCTACQELENCNIPVCTSYDDTTCGWCVGELDREVPGYNVYTGKPDPTSCKLACSWRDGYRCFPGTCTGDMLYDDDCTCASGFTGSNCATATTAPVILKQFLDLEGDGELNKYTADISLSDGKFWTNVAQWSTVAVNASSMYTPTIDGQNIPNYIVSYPIGIEDITVTATLYRGTDESHWIAHKDCSYSELCELTSKTDIEQTPWNTIFSGRLSPPFFHMDRILFTMSTTNGGIITYIDREAAQQYTYSIAGLATTQSLEIGFDFIPPVHCFETSHTCSQDSLTINDFNTQLEIAAEWDGWTDVDSGMYKYVFNLHYLAVKDLEDPKLEPSYILPEVTLDYNQASTTLSFTDPGPYAVEIIAFDQADNYKSSRRIILVDNESVVEKRDPSPTVVQANGQSWINTASDEIEMQWLGRFINRRHHDNGWLNEVKADPNIGRDLEDTSSRSARSVDAVYNVDGIVRFEIGYTTELEEVSTFVNFVPVPDEYFETQNMIYKGIELTDGQRLTYSVRAFDVLEEFAEDNITVTVDMSPPVIQNLWLTKGDFVNVSVHSVQELNELTFEWDVYDFHSGMYELKWRIFDNYTNEDIDHGESFVSLQGNVQTLEECEEQYKDSPGGHDCYCSPYNGCYHRHHQITPQVTNTGADGIHSGKDIGVHDYDYFIEIIAINNAGLTSFFYNKFTIDVSPPHEGTVYDGISGEPEVDYQQSLELAAHWDGFFDKESSVWFYTYGFDKECLTAEDLDVHSLSEKGHQTYENAATFTVTESGKYYITVVAYNHALDGSKPVCSDGVTINNSPASVSEVVVDGAVTSDGLIKDAASGNVYFLHRNREIEQYIGLTLDCSDKATVVSNESILLTPHRRLINGTRSIRHVTNCSLLSGVHADVLSYLTSVSHLELSWNASQGVAGVYDFEVGISSTDSDVADVMDFETTHGHKHKIVYHPDVFNGQRFFILIKTTTKSNVINIQTVGPFAVDTTKPVFSGKILLLAEADTSEPVLIARWDENAFVDHGDPNPLHYEIAIGNSVLSQDILPFQDISAGGSCTSLLPATCATISTHLLPWHLHALQTYYVAIKATNTIGLSMTASSDEYIHSVRKATAGVVHDIDIDSNVTLTDIDDIDYQVNTNQLSVRWFGFQHPFSTIVFYVCLTNTPSADDLLECEGTDTDTTHTFSDLNLETYTTYYLLVIAETEAGNVTAISDGVTIVVEGDTIEGMEIFDGPVCNNSYTDDFREDLSHHTEDKRVLCNNSIGYQSSTNRLQAHWTLPSENKHYQQDVYWAVEERAPVVEFWKQFKDYEYLRTTGNTLADSGLSLTAGRRYRIVLKTCAGRFCFEPVKSSGITVTPNPPVPGTLSVSYSELSRELGVHFGLFRDPDIEDLTESRDAIDHYEWAFTDGSINEKLLTKWKRVDQVTSSPEEMTFTIGLDNEVRFTKCWKLAVRGYSKAGLSALVAANIKNCSDIQQVRPSTVIDAVGESEQDNIGNPISLEENAVWPHLDVDYTSFKNIISAVWPTLRHKNYSWAVLNVMEEDATIFYDQSTDLDLQDPCSHPDAVKCGTTVLGYVNVIFDDDELEHGSRYIVCVHANATSLEHEVWTQELPEISSCSDGVTIDLTPPSAGEVWIGNEKTMEYQTSTSDLSVNWQSFIDVEEQGYAVHTSGIARYEVAVGTMRGGVDVIPMTNVGLTNHKMFHGTHLLSGQTYYATVRGYDFTGQSSVSYSDGVTVDTSPPVTSDSRINVIKRHITNTEYVDVCWNDVFSDQESGMSHYSWSVGTHAGYDNILPYTDSADECSSTPEDQPLSLTEGHAYFINVKAYNKAGQYTVASSWAFLVDASEPEPGYVFDGNNTTEDLDYIEASSSIYACWKGFHDPHTPIKEYSISLGTCKGCENVKVWQPVGLREYTQLTHLHLAEGIQYFVTVTACNTADLCTSASSDGFVVDSTPPIPGHVIDGTLASDVQFQSTRNYIGCKWYGFTDPQSQIKNYVWRVGTSKGQDDVMSATDCHKMKEAFIFDLPNDLPENVQIFCTVRAYNFAGKYVESSSNGFIVDSTPPVFDKQVTLSPVGSISELTSILRSLVKIEWIVDDTESFIDIQYISISSHIGGDFNLSSVQMEGIVRDYIFTNLDLHDGSYYDIKVLSCNGAKLCTESVLENILVDSTPPTTGTFAINTDHAAMLNRQSESWMAWTPISVSLAWLGFEDVHSGIESYSINIGSNYMGNDLNEIPYVPYIITHDGNAPFLEDGFVQTFTFNTQPLSKHKTVYISVTAKNKVGLSSEVLHAQFNLVYGGMVELIRRCDSHTCYGHCVCAPHGQVCSADTSVCVDTSGNGNVNTLIEVKDSIDITFPSDNQLLSWSPVNTMLSGKWSVSASRGKQPQWYECSIGESAFDTPQGIFDEITDRVWHAVGQNTEHIFSLKRGLQMSERVKYSVYVRVWYDENTFAVFKSPGVTILSNPPSTSVLLGRSVKEIIAGGSKDIDFITSNTHVNAYWTGKFLNTGDSLWRYHLYISTIPGGHDTQILSTNIPSDVTSYNITGLKLEEYTKYYTVVQAYNHAGLHSTAVSDGFMLDLNPPTLGVVMDGQTLVDIDASNNSHVLSAFWHGFSDLESGIIKYEHCISSASSDSNCNIRSMSSAGISVRTTYNSPESFPQGVILYNKVRAKDAVGHVSETVSSNGVKVDTSPPVRVWGTLCQNNILLDYSFENTSSLQNDNAVCVEMKDDSWQSSEGTCVFNSNNTYHGDIAVVLQGTLHQSVKVEHKGHYRLTFFISAVSSGSLHLATSEGYVSINSEKHTVLLYDKPYSTAYLWQKHTFFFDISDDSIVLSIGTVRDKSVFALDDVKLELCQDSLTEPSDTSGHVNAHSVFVHDWSSIHADWTFADPETDIVEYLWAIGTVNGGTQLQGFTSVGKRKFASSNSVHLEHNTDVYVTVVAVNEAQLRTVSYSDAIKVDLTPPEFRFIHDGAGDDIDYQAEPVLSVHWDVTDPESDITECRWAIGTSPNDTSIQDFLQVATDSSNASKVLEDPPDEIVFVTVKCENGAGLTATASTDGVKILQNPPSIDGMVLQLMTTSNTQFLPRGIYHGNRSEIKFRWSGFSHNEGVDSFEIQLDGYGVSIKEIVQSAATGYNYAGFTGLELQDGEYNVSVTAINEMHMQSERKSETFYLLTTSPRLTGEEIQTSWNSSISTATASWKDVFDLEHPMFYEVTVRLDEGGEGDLVQWQETRDTEIDVVLETDSIPVNGVFVVFSVRAVSYSGLFTIQHAHLLVTTHLRVKSVYFHFIFGLK